MKPNIILGNATIDREHITPLGEIRLTPESA